MLNDVIIPVVCYQCLLLYCWSEEEREHVYLGNNHIERSLRLSGDNIYTFEISIYLVTYLLTLMETPLHGKRIRQSNGGSITRSGTKWKLYFKRNGGRCEIDAPFQT